MYQEQNVCCSARGRHLQTFAAVSPSQTATISQRKADHRNWPLRHSLWCFLSNDQRLTEWLLPLLRSLWPSLPLPHDGVEPWTVWLLRVCEATVPRGTKAPSLARTATVQCHHSVAPQTEWVSTHSCTRLLRQITQGVCECVCARVFVPNSYITSNPINVSFCLVAETVRPDSSQRQQLTDVQLTHTVISAFWSPGSRVVLQVTLSFEYHLLKSQKKQRLSAASVVLKVPPKLIWIEVHHSDQGRRRGSPS